MQETHIENACGNSALVYRGGHACHAELWCIIELENFWWNNALQLVWKWNPKEDSRWTQKSNFHNGFYKTFVVQQFVEQQIKILV